VILLDTHVVVWAAIEHKRLSRAAESALRRARAGGGLAMASISLWEMALLFARGRIETYGTIEAWVGQVLETVGIVVKPITQDQEIAILAAQFPESYTPDPADRLIGVSARAEGIALIAQDERIRSSPLLRTIGWQAGRCRARGEGRRTSRQRATGRTRLASVRSARVFRVSGPDRRQDIARTRERSEIMRDGLSLPSAR
jgi:PIN domain nuclease of toxin-antitoxin system